MGFFVLYFAVEMSLVSIPTNKEHLAQNVPLGKGFATRNSAVGFLVSFAHFITSLTLSPSQPLFFLPSFLFIILPFRYRSRYNPVELTCAIQL